MTNGLKHKMKGCQESNSGAKEKVWKSDTKTRHTMTGDAKQKLSPGGSVRHSDSLWFTRTLHTRLHSEKFCVPHHPSVPTVSPQKQLEAFPKMAVCAGCLVSWAPFSSHLPLATWSILPTMADRTQAWCLELRLIWEARTRAHFWLRSNNCDE